MRVRRVSFALVLATVASSSACGTWGLDFDDPDQVPTSNEGGTGGFSGVPDDRGGTGGRIDPSGSGGNSSGGSDGLGGEPGCSGDDCEPRGFLIHDTFEALTLPGSVVSENLGWIKRTSDKSYSGDASLHLGQGSTSEASSFIQHGVEPIVSGNIYSRAWLYIPQGLLTGQVELMRLGSDTAFPHQIFAAVRREIFAWAGSPVASSKSDAFPESEWFCLQADLKVDELVGSWVVRVNGEEVIRISDMDTLFEHGISKIEYGLISADGGQEDASFYIDDVIFDDQPVGCDTAIASDEQRAESPG